MNQSNIPTQFLLRLNELGFKDNPESFANQAALDLYLPNAVVRACLSGEFGDDGYDLYVFDRHPERGHIGSTRYGVALDGNTPLPVLLATLNAALDDARG